MLNVYPHVDGKSYRVVFQQGKATAVYRLLPRGRELPLNITSGNATARKAIKEALASLARAGRAP